jgi:hypothetical protein
MQTPDKCQSIQERAGGVAQMVEHLFSKCEDLSSMPTSAKKKRIEKNLQERKRME